MARDRDREETSRRRSSRDEESSSRSERSSSRRSESRGTGFRYQSRTAEQTSKRASQSGGDFDAYLRDGVKMFKPADGDNTIRIFPPTWEGAEHFGFDVWVHYGIGPDNQAYLCLDKMKGKPCPPCEARKKALEDKDDDYADSLKPSKRVLTGLLDRDNEKEGPQVWSMPWTIDRDICKLVIDKKTGEILPVDDPENGYDIEFTKQGKEKLTKYIGLSVARRKSELGNDKALEWIAENPLPELLQYYDYDHIEKVFGGHSSKKSDKSSKDNDDEKEDKTSSRSRKPSNDNEDELSWEQIHDMTFRELDSLIEDKKLDIDPESTKSDEELADIICEELNISKPRKKIGDDEQEDDSPKAKLERMRRNRER